MSNVPADIPEQYRIEWITRNLDKFCVLPFINLNTNPNGNLKLCCNIQNDHFLNENDVPFNLGYHDIDMLWNSDYMKSVRQGHRSNVGHNHCQECYKIEETTGHSPRVGQNVEWVKRTNVPIIREILAKASSDNLNPSIDNYPISLELRLGNQCNLKCISCYAMSSSLIHDERTEMLENGYVEGIELGWLKYKWTTEKDLVNNSQLKAWFETETFYNNFRKMAPNLYRLYVTGGEPTLIKANYKLLQMLLDANNTDCRIEFTSNMFVWNNDFYSRLEQFKNVEVQMSIDGAEIIGEYIRYPSNFKKVRENVEKVMSIASKKQGNWRMKCYSVYQALNYKHLEPVWDLLFDMAHKYEVKIDWWPITLYYPEYLSMAAVPLEKRVAYAEQLKKIIKKYSVNNDYTAPAYFTFNPTTEEACVNSLTQAPYDPELHSRLIQAITVNDKFRNVTGMEIFKDILT